MSRHRFMLDVESSITFDSSLVDGWFFNGTNDNFPTSIAGVNGNEMILYNFAGTAESGFNNGLNFDGVDDYIQCDNLSKLTDFTVIIKRTILSDYFVVASKAEWWQNGAFICETSTESNGGGRCFGGQCGFLWIGKTERTIYMTSSFYGDSINGIRRSFDKGPGEDSNILYMGTGTEKTDFTQMNVKYILLYNKSLTESEIQAEIEKAEKKFLE